MAEQPRMLDHILAVYDYMEEHSIDKNGDPIYEGKTTEIIRVLGLSNNYYTPIFRYLNGGNYITQIRRGGGGTTSMYQLNGRPDPDDFDDILLKTGAQNTRTSKALQTVAGLKQEVARLRGIVDQHTKILVTMQTAVINLNTQVNGIGNDPFAGLTSTVPQVEEEDKPTFEEPDFTDLTGDGE